MCRAATCLTCGKVTWSGCGQHVEQVMRDVPPEQQCTCPDAERRPQGLLDKLLRR